MDHSNSVSPRNNGQDKTWDTQSSAQLKHLEPEVVEEDTPLLGNGEGAQEHEWDGAADFLNVPWWNKPSVSDS